MTNRIYNCELLCNAVVHQAAMDYREALVRQHDAYLEHDEKEMQHWDKEVAKLKRFFTGDGITSYTKLNGTVLMNRLQQEIIDYRYDLCALRRDLLFRGRSRILAG